jgi:membrane protein DedA with SNARE-associated domain
MDPLGDLVHWIALYGIFGLIAIGFAERFVPIVPSHGMLVAIGIAAYDGAWSVPLALIGTTSGSFLGTLGVYTIARVLGEKNSKLLLYWIGKWVGLSQVRIDRTSSFLRTRERTLTIVSQLIPAVRLISPVVSGLVRTSPSRFVTGSVIGITLWNGSFIAAGYLVVSVVPDINSSVLALKVLLLLLVTETLVVLVLRFQIHVSRQPVLDGNK